MAKTASDILIETLCDWGVEVIFGLPGDGINGIMESLRTHQDKIKFIQVRHEEAAAFAACGYAKFTGKLGVCLATSGPGGIHLLNGLYDAKLDGQPVLAITGLQFHDLINTHTQQDVELDKLYQDVSIYNTRIMGPDHVENVAELACRTALAYRGVAHISFPVDMQEMPLSKDVRSKRNVKNHVNSVYNYGIRLPDEEALRKAADVINEGKKVAILAGRGALNATDELLKLAELLGAPIAKALLGKAVVPDDSPWTTGPIGLLGSKPSGEAMEGCDTLLIIGSSFPYIEFLPKPGQARAVQIDSDPMRISLRYPVEVGLVGEAKQTIAALLPFLKYKNDRSFLEKIQKGMGQWRQLMKERETRMDVPMKPQVVASEVGKRLADNAIVTSDSGTIATWWARHIPAKRGQMYSLSGNLATMANGFPYAIAAQVAFPHRQVVAFVGDGGFSMLMAEFATCVKYNLPVKVVIIKNNTLGQIKWEQMVFLGNPEFGVDLQPIDFDSYAKACGGKGYTIEKPQDCGSILDEAMHAEGPAVIQAVVDPFEPPMPGKVTWEQAEHLAQSLARGEPDRSKIMATVAKDMVKELI